MGTLRKLGHRLEEAAGKQRSWSEVLRACGGNEGIAYVVMGTLEGIADKKKPDAAFSDAVEDQNFYGNRPDVVQARKQAQDILEKAFRVKVAYVGESIDEAVKRQGQILPTENEAWGYFGTAYTNFNDEKYGDNPRMLAQAAWHAVFYALMQEYPSVSSKAIREFLDNKTGRHFADEVIDADRSMLLRSVQKVLRASGSGAWISKELGIVAGTAIGVPPGGTAELALKVKEIVDLFATVRDQEAKKNWKQQAQAMHQLETQADALVTATRAWFTNSGRTPTYEISAGGAKGQPYRKVRVTIPEDKE